MASGYGNVVQHWQVYGEAYIVSQNETTATVRCDTYFHSIGWGYNVNGNGTATVNGQSANSGRVTCYAPTGGTVNQHLVTKDVTVSKGRSAYNVGCQAVCQLTGGYHNGTSTVNLTVGIPALRSSTVSYNANGGTGAPGAQTKWCGSILTLSSTRPTRTGYTFQGWSTSTDSSVEYQPGSQYGADANVTLYAVWRANTWTVSYNANGGSGAPGNQTKVYGQTLTLSSTRPTRNLYNFRGWGTSSGSTTPSYQPGGAYTNNASITLYAVWELAWVAPRITNLQATRCTSDGTLNEDGTYAKVSFNWATDRTVSSIKIVCNGETINGSGSGTSGSVSLVLGKNLLNTENSYTVTVTVTDSVGSSSMPTTIAPINYIIDFAPNGSVAIGKPANKSAREFEIASRIRYSGAITGFKEEGYATDGNSYRVLARSANTYDDLGSSGKVRIVGQIGQYTSPGSIDITVQFRAGNEWAPRINVMTDQALNASETSLQVIIGNDKYVYIVIWRKSSGGYYFYDLQLYGEEVRIVNSAWSSSRPAGTVKFDTNVKATGIYYPSKYVNRNGYWGFSLPTGAEDDWIRTTKTGLIPYQAGGYGSLGTEGWPFGGTWTNSLSWTGNGLRGRVMKQIWSGTADRGAIITVGEHARYNGFIAKLNDPSGRNMVWCTRSLPGDMSVFIAGVGGYSDTNNAVRIQGVILHSMNSTQLKVEGLTGLSLWGNPSTASNSSFDNRQLIRLFGVI